MRKPSLAFYNGRKVSAKVCVKLCAAECVMKLVVHIMRWDIRIWLGGAVRYRNPVFQSRSKRLTTKTFVGRDRPLWRCQDDGRRQTTKASKPIARGVLGAELAHNPQIRLRQELFMYMNSGYKDAYSLDMD